MTPEGRGHREIGGTVRLGRGRPITVFASGEFPDPEAGVDQLRHVAADVRGTRALFYYEQSGHFHEVPRLRRQADRDAQELLAVADATRASSAVGISRGARAVVGALAEEPTRFEKVALLVPPGGNAVGFFRDWLTSIGGAEDTVSAEVLVLALRGDAAHPVPVAEDWARRLHARIEVFDKVGEVPGPEQLRRAVTDFLNRA